MLNMPEVQTGLIKKMMSRIIPTTQDQVHIYDRPPAESLQGRRRLATSSKTSCRLATKRAYTNFM